jgi:hypothetical protein
MASLTFHLFWKFRPSNLSRIKEEKSFDPTATCSGPHPDISEFACAAENFFLADYSRFSVAGVEQLQSKTVRKIRW